MRPALTKEKDDCPPWIYKDRCEGLARRDVNQACRKISVQSRAQSSAARLPPPPPISQGWDLRLLPGGRLQCCLTHGMPVLSLAPVELTPTFPSQHSSRPAFAGGNAGRTRTRAPAAALPEPAHLYPTQGASKANAKPTTRTAEAITLTKSIVQGSGPAPTRSKRREQL
jgi:hypothetical protein